MSLDDNHNNIEINRENIQATNESMVIESSRAEIRNILYNFLTDEEKRIISGVPNPEIRDIIMQIINELGKRICKGDTPSQKLFDDVCYKVLGKNNIRGGGVYFGYSKSIIKQLPDWKGFGNLFDYDNPNNSNPSVLEFRKKRGGIDQTQHVNRPQTISHSTMEHGNQHTNRSLLEPKGEVIQMETKPIEEQKEQQQIKPKIKANYEKISTIGYKGKISKFMRTDGMDTEIPLLEPEDIGVCQYMNGWVSLTENAKVPCCRWLDNKMDFEKIGVKDFFIDGVYVGNGDKPYCFYNPIDDISHIVTFCTNRGGNISTEIVIKGKVSQQDAIELFKYVKEKTGLQTDRTNGNQPKMLLDGSFVQQLVMEYLNNK